MDTPSKVGVVKPFGDRIAVVDPPAAEQTPSGLIIVSDEMEVAEGIVVSNADYDVYFGMARAFGVDPSGGDLKKGTLVYYQKHTGVRIGDVRIIDTCSIIAYEEA